MVSIFFGANDFSDKVKKVLENNEPYAEQGRYKSWEHCYSYFHFLHQEKLNGIAIADNGIDLACYKLGFYLASWGMFRGSGFIYKYDHTIYKEIVDIILKADNKLWDFDKNLIENIKNKSEIKGLEDSIFNLGKKINDVLIPYKNASNGKKQKTSEKSKGKCYISGTLITKILLGTIGCIPGFDDNFQKSTKIPNKDFCPDNIESVVSCAVINISDINKERANYCLKEGGLQYPIMKLLDIYYFEEGLAIKKPKKSIGTP